MSVDRDDRDAIHPLSRRFLFIETQGFKTFVFIALAIATLGLAAIDFAFHRHAYFDFEGWRGFYALVGFVSFSFAVLCGWPLRRLLGRPENYYGGGDEDA